MTNRAVPVGVVLAAVLSTTLAADTLKLGTASGQPGQIVEVPLLADLDEPLGGFGLGPTFLVLVSYDSRLEPLGFELAGAAARAAVPPGNGVHFEVRDRGRVPLVSIPPNRHPRSLRG